ncbi:MULTISPECIES: restriction endonuclease subunit S [Enterobacteriaceae]|uniref:restriction endonuclease subunit S n=1 Tax=Enterobacteriaceae TaxID=543 RepID=UPI0007A5E0F6|nr:MULTISPECIES: restriction endonuclease subunit S [Enterobacteriaceae]HCE8953036.1 restriction endonuclease subunit S [Raoultella ornithinolytica]EEU9115866.1 restriction endonuclease subunit S [Escherichia coli]EEV8835281.1 restriction endonuclease subunit S [Escherichia coli]EFB4374635.1 restriction endonuclease subunit S [Escherichia coli]EFB9733606.1 restriction endonuclease subunit S [Escherichia coli]
MSQWIKTKLGEIVILNYGKALKAQDRNAGSIPVYSSGGLTGWHNKALINEQGIIIGRKGTVGKAYLTYGPFWCIDTAYYILPNPSKYDFVFLFYLLKTLGLEELNEDSAVPGLNRDTAYSQEILLPSLPEQKAIASVLSSLDDKIDLLHRQNKTLESMAETLFRQWFIEDAQIHWTEKKLSSFGSIICGKTPSKKNSLYFGNDVPFLKIPDMHGKVFVFKSTDNLSFAGEHSQSKKTIPPGSICVSCIATVGLVCITDVSMQTNQQINSIIPNKEYYKYFLYLLMKSMGDELNNLASGGTATLNLNTGDFSNITFLSPSENELKIFHQSISSLFDKLKFNSKQINIIENLRDTLLPKLMSGEVQVQYVEEAIASVA